jgi:hypothetical protein
VKYGGKKLTQPNAVTLVLPREDATDIVIRCRAVLDYEEFNKILPQPTPPTKVLRGGAKQPDFEHPSFKVSMNQYAASKTQWMVLKSIETGPDTIQWETVDMADTATWGNYEKELMEAGFSEIERQRILGAVMEANSLNESKLNEARERFLFGQLEMDKKRPNESTSQNGVAKSTPSGDLVNVSA